MSRAGLRSASAARRVLAICDEQDVSVNELAARTGIPRSTLDRNLKRAPHLISIPDFEDIAEALGVSFEELFGMAVSA